MTNPIDVAPADAVQRWHTISRFTPTDPAARARIERAQHLADQTIADAVLAGWMRRASGTPNPAGQLDAAMVWSHVALMWHQVLTDTDMFTTARTTTQTACRRDADKIRQWLKAANPDGDATIAATLGVDEYFDLYGFDKLNQLTRLVAAAQDAAVFGIDGHRVDIIHEAGDRGYVNHHRVTLTTPQHGTVCSEPIDSLDLFSDHLAGPDAAIHALTVIAQHADELLAQRALLADTLPTPTPAQANRPDQARQPTPGAEKTARPATEPAQPPAASAPTGASAPSGRAFRPLAGQPHAAQPTPPELTPQPASRNGHTR